jgi:hypothetical protein
MPFIASRNGRAKFIAATPEEVAARANSEECKILGVPAAADGTLPDAITWGREHVINPDGSVDTSRLAPGVLVGGWWRIEEVDG